MRGFIVGISLLVGLSLGEPATSSAAASTSAAQNELPPPEVAPGGAGAPLTPVTSQLIEPPAPFNGSDGHRHLAFELILTNISPRQATVVSAVVKANTSTGAVLQQLSGSQVANSMTLIGDLTLAKAANLPSYAAGALLLDAVLPDRAPVPKQLAVTLTSTFQAPLPGQPSYVSIYPDSATEQLPAVPVSTTKPLVLPAPLTGGDWVTTNSCCDLSAHRGAILGGAGVPVSPERYAIDFVRIDGQGNLYQPGAPQSMKTNFSYGAKLLAVAPATVVAIQNGLPDQPPGVNPTGYSLNQLGGNYIVLKLSGHVYALYAHISPGTIKVKLGQKVTTGQTLGLLGNSGNSTAPHLHFQLMDGPGLLTSQGVPYEFRTTTLMATPSPQETFEPVNPPKTLRNAYPLTNSVVAFPGGTSANVSPAPVPNDGTQPGT